MGGVRDGYSNFEFFEVFAPQAYSVGSLTGATVDKQGYETLTFIFGAGEISGIASALQSVASAAWLRMQHATSNAAGTRVWSNVSKTDMLVDLRLSTVVAGNASNTAGLASISHAILRVSGTGSGMDQGTFFVLGGVSADNQSWWESRVHAAGYIGDHRWVRIVASVSDAGDMSALGIYCIAILGLESDWPVNTVRRVG